MPRKSRGKRAIQCPAWYLVYIMIGRCGPTVGHAFILNNSGTQGGAVPTPEQLVAALPTGKAHAIHAKQLEPALGIEPGGVNSDKTREFVRRATIEHDLPIGGGLELFDK